MKEYLKMSDVFEGVISVRSCTAYCETDGEYAEFAVFDNKADAEYASHAINSHDELVRKLDVAESTLFEVERVLSEMQKNGSYGLDDVIAEVELCIKRLKE